MFEPMAESQLLTFENFFDVVGKTLILPFPSTDIFSPLCG